MPHVDPTIRFWLGVAISVCTGLAGSAALFTNAIPGSWIPVVLSWAGIFAFAGNIVLTALNRLASTDSSRIASADAVTGVKHIEVTPALSAIADQHEKVTVVGDGSGAMQAGNTFGLNQHNQQGPAL